MGAGAGEFEAVGTVFTAEEAGVEVAGAGGGIGW
jgi:hypothetical protein